MNKPSFSYPAALKKCSPIAAWRKRVLVIHCPRCKLIFSSAPTSMVRQHYVPHLAPSHTTSQDIHTQLHHVAYGMSIEMLPVNHCMPGSPCYPEECTGHLRRLGPAMHAGSGLQPLLCGLTAQVVPHRDQAHRLHREVCYLGALQSGVVRSPVFESVCGFWPCWTIECPARRCRLAAEADEPWKMDGEGGM